MIKDIQELNFPEYATLSQATVTLQDMGEKTITSTVKFDGCVTPDFTYDWIVEFQGEKYIMPLRKPQGLKDNASMLATVELTFQHWAIYWLKQKYFFQYTSTEAGVAIPDKWIVPLRLNLKNFCEYLEKVLDYWYGDKITVALNPSWQYDAEPVGVDISYSKIWDVLIKLYELYGVRWQIAPKGNIDHYEIKIGYPTTEVSHIFEYGFEGGLLKTERQVQSDEIANVIMGRGGDKNLPYRYYKDTDPDNDSFAKDPDWVPELKDVFFSELHGATFRSYIQGWNHRKYGRTKVTSAEMAYAPWAWRRGYTDCRKKPDTGELEPYFNPVEFVADEFIDSDNGYGVKPHSSIAQYGELMDALENNEEIYPTIQGVEIEGLGRVDETVAIEPIESDDVTDAAESDAQTTNVGGASRTIALEANQRERMIFDGASFEVPNGQYANFDEGEKVISLTKDAVKRHVEVIKGKWSVKFEYYQIEVKEDRVVIENAIVTVIDESTGEERSASGIPGGKYRYRVALDLHNTGKEALNITVACEAPLLTYASITTKWTNTWDIWVKNIWQTDKSSYETDEQYAERVWRPILGDHLGGEAKIVFSDGWLSTSEDYEFAITAIPVYDPSKTLEKKDAQGNIVDTYHSHWRITLAKSDADMESTGLFVPSTKRQAVAGDHFFFIGIDLPHQYVLWAEIRLDDWKKDNLNTAKDIKPSWVVGLDKVRIHNHGNANALIESLKIGNSIRLADKRFVVNEIGTEAAYETLYLQSVTYTYTEPTDKEANMFPDVEVVLSDEYETSANPVSSLQSEVSALSRQVGAISNVEQVVRAVGDKLYLRKDGIPDRSMSPTEFGSLVTSTGFRNGIIGGSGWGLFRDESGNWVLEADRVNVRQQMQVNTLVANQVKGRGGMTVESAAIMEITRVDETESGYVCYFDQKEGSVANLFEIDDIAFCNRYTPEYGDLKFYKRRVVAVADNSVTLSHVEKNGEGIPEKGDVIIQYGNYTIAERQYVIVRDVVGGGYERYIEGLDSVSSDGTEYYFVGRQAGMYNGKPRWFVGTQESNIEFIDGQFLLKNVTLSATSKIEDKPIVDYVTENIEVGGTNLVLNSDVRNNLPLSSTSETLIWYSLSAPMEVNNHYVMTVWAPTSSNRRNLELHFRDKEGNVGKRVLRSKTTGVWQDKINAEGEWVEFALVRMVSQVVVERVKVERGDVGTDWSPAPTDVLGEYDYLTRAIKESTTIKGGLVMASLMQMGYSVDDGYVVKSGINGIYAKEEPGGGPALWAGGEMIDMADETLTEADKSRAAQWLVRMDGTGYMAGNSVRFSDGRMEMGDNLVLDANEFFMATSDGGRGFVVKPDKIGYDPTDTSNLTPDRKIPSSRTITATNNWYSPTSQSSYIATTFTKQLVNIGFVGQGATIKVRINAYFDQTVGTSAGTIIPDNKGYLSVRLIDGDRQEILKLPGASWLRKLQSSDPTFSTETYRYYISYDVDVAIPEAHASCQLEVESYDDFGELNNYTPDGKLNASVALRMEVVLANSYAYQNIIGTDGIAFNWGKSLVCATAEGVALRYGNDWIRLDESGIHVKSQKNGRELLLEDYIKSIVGI